MAIAGDIATAFARQKHTICSWIAVEVVVSWFSFMTVVAPFSHLWGTGSVIVYFFVTIIRYPLLVFAPIGTCNVFIRTEGHGE